MTENIPGESFLDPSRDLLANNLPSAFQMRHLPPQPTAAPSSCDLLGEAAPPFSLFPLTIPEFHCQLLVFCIERQGERQLYLPLAQSLHDL